MAGECYAMVLPNHKPRKDWQMPTVTIVGVVLLFVMGGVIFAICRTEYRYNRFRADWLNSFVYAERHHSFEVFEGEEKIKQRKMLADGVDFLFWKGRPRKVPEEAPKLKITFGDGSNICYWETDFADYSGGHGAEIKPGVILAYTNAAGKIYCVESEGDYYLLRAWLRGEVKDFNNPTWDEMKLIEEARGGTP